MEDIIKLDLNNNKKIEIFELGDEKENLILISKGW